MATAQALITSKPTTKEGKKAVKSITKEMEKIAEASTTKGGPNATKKGATDVDYNTIPDEEFDKIWNQMKMGRTAIPAPTG